MTAQPVYDFCNSENEVTNVTVSVLAKLPEDVPSSAQAMVGFWRDSESASIKFIFDPGPLNIYLNPMFQLPTGKSCRTRL